MSWQAASLVLLALALIAGFGWYERDKPPARILALVATMAALAVVGRLAFAAIPNVKPTTDIVLFAGYALGAVPGFAVGAVTAIVSNVFLSQGPWTPWQMVGWGAVGVAGAALALVMRGREPEPAGARRRLRARRTCLRRLDGPLPAHPRRPPGPRHLSGAVGKLAPLQPRPCDRKRRVLPLDRPGVHPRPAPLPPPPRGALARSRGRGRRDAAAGARPGPARPPRGAASPADRAERWLARTQNKDGGFGPVAGASSSPLFSGWAGLGLAAAGHNPRDLRRPGGRSLAAYVARGGASLKDVGEIERTILVVEAAGLSARDFAGKDLVAAVQSRRRGNGSIAGYVSYTAFGVIALRAAGVPAGKATVSWLVSSQNADGGFGVAPSSTSDSDMTGATLQALSTVGRARGGAATRAVAWLRANQNDDGGFGQFKGRSSNAQSTSYAIQGLVAAGAGGATLSRSLAYLRGLQRSNGSVSYSSSSTQTPVWVTAQALMAFERTPLPIAAVPRAERKPRTSAGESGEVAPAAPAGQGGKTSNKGSAAAAKAGEKARAGDATPSTGTTAGDEPSPAAGEASPPSRDTGLRLDPPRDAGGDDEGGGPALWLVALLVAAAGGLVWVFRRRLLPPKLRARLPRRRSA